MVINIDVRFFFYSFGFFYGVVFCRVRVFF